MVFCHPHTTNPTGTNLDCNVGPSSVTDTTKSADHHDAGLSTVGSNSAGTSSTKNLSCLQCRKRKTRCDRKYPCSPCIIRGEQAGCTQVQQTIASITTSSATPAAPSGAQSSAFSPIHVGDRRTLPTPPKTGYDDHSPQPPERHSAFGSDRLLLLETRMERIEALLTRHLSPHNAQAPALKRRRSHDEEPNLRPNHDRASASPPPLGETIEDLFEDAAMGRKLKLETLPISQSRPASANKDTDDDDLAALQTAPDPARDVAFRFAHFLPAAAPKLLDFYFARIDWTARTLPPDVHAVFLRLARMSPEEIAAFPVSSAVVCCYFVVIALALHFADEALLRSAQLTSQDASQLADTLCTGSQQLLWASNFLQSQQLEHLACVCLLGVYQHNRKEQADSQWALLGSAIKVAQNLGLSRLDHGVFSCASSSIQGEAQKELARRIWWNLVWLDWSHASAHFGVYSVHPSQNRTKLPANVDINRDSLTLRSADEYTHSSAISMRMRYVSVYREIVDQSNERGALDCAQIYRYVDKLNDIHASTPPCLRYTPDRASEQSDQAMESVMLELMYLNRILRLHRGHQLSGFTSEDWRFARKACLSSASRMIRILSLVGDSVIHKFWLTTFYLLGASMALVMELCCARPHEVDAHTVRESINAAISLLSKAGPGSEAAHNSRRILQELLSCEPKIRSAFAKSGGLERIAEQQVGRQDTKDVFLDILKRILGPSIRNKRKRAHGMIHTSAEAGHAKRQQSAQPTTNAAVTHPDSQGSRITEAGNAHVAGLHTSPGEWLNGISLFSPVTATNRTEGASTAGTSSIASVEGDWPDQSLLPSLEGMFSGDMVQERLSVGNELAILDADVFLADGNVHECGIGKVGSVRSEDFCGLSIVEEAACIVERGKDKRGAAVEGQYLERVALFERVGSEDGSSLVHGLFPQAVELYSGKARSSGGMETGKTAIGLSHDSSRGWRSTAHADNAATNGAEGNRGQFRSWGGGGTVRRIGP
ncbi:hypothetical protein BCV70DRAFT_209018 [Testicularia cyperi]|uniref:Zn(2)-C6 fungal-type domain-containing protein n=1 Tax=Testicularia cyperi TaxID=1882483 RepID=A0A317XGA4_9BASI|nr:hypothetical protein BCV70DRAFT_209018 [Testicularia cyperi]